jgi:enoyl-CoA hydratase/carnithine racemase
VSAGVGRDSIDVSSEDGVALVRIDHPPANALDPALLAESLGALERVRADDPPAVVLTGSGRFFSAGADLRVVPALSGAEQADMARDINRLFAGWYRLPRPVVTAVNGHAVAGGLVLALCGDYRIGPRSGQFGLTEVRVGIPYPSVAFAVVTRELSPPVARRLALAATLVDSTTALDAGVFDEVVDDEDVLARALQVARDLAALPPRTYALTKQRLRSGVGESTDRAFGGSEQAEWATEEAGRYAERHLDRPR